MNSTVKKILNIAEKVLSWILIAFTVFMMIFTIVTVTTVDKNDRSFFGFRVATVLSDSMSKSDKNAHMKVHFNAGDIIITKEIPADKKDELEEGDIVSFYSEEHDAVITHMIRRHVYDEKTGRLIGYVTFGTNTDTDDESILEPEWVISSYVGKIPYVGHLFSFLQTTPGYIVCILIPFLLLILYNLGNVIKLFRKYKKEQSDAIAAERQQIEDERAENQRMMQELLELKAQLMKNGAAGLAPEAENKEISENSEENSEEKSEISDENETNG